MFRAADLTKNSGSEKEDRKRLSVLEGALGRFRFSGDIRVRDDSIFQSCASCFDRNRARLRVRFGLEGKLNEDFTGGYFLATGVAGRLKLHERNPTKAAAKKCQLLITGDCTSVRFLFAFPLES